jgi:hypothetical protein
MADVAFDPVLVGAYVPAEEIVVENFDSEPLELAPAVLRGADATAFQIGLDYCDDAPLEPGDACSVWVRFRPLRVGAHSATLDIEVAGDPEPLSVQLSGEGLPWLKMTPSALDFAILPTTRTQPQDVFVENVSGRTISTLFVRLSRYGTGFGIAADTCRRATLAPGATCRVSVSFTISPFAGPVSEEVLKFVNGADVVASVALRGTVLRLPAAGGETVDTPDVSALLGRRLRAALAPLRGGNRGRAALLRRGLVVRGIVPPVPGLLRLEVWARGSKRSPARLVAVRRRLAAQADRPARIRAKLTRAGRRLLRSGRPLVLEIELTMTAQADKLVSKADGVLRLARTP